VSGIVLYDYWRSSSAYRVRIGLNLAGLDYERRPVDLSQGEQREAAHLAVNPQGLVPVLEIDGQRLTQSLAILEYLHTMHGAGFLSPDAAGQARVRALAYAVAMEIQPICNLRVARWVKDSSDGAIGVQQWMQQFIAAGLADLEAMLAGSDGAFCHDDRVSLADICLVPQVYNARRWGVDLSGMPRIAAIAARAEALPAFAAAHPDRVKPEA